MYMVKKKKLNASLLCDWMFEKTEKVPGSVLTHLQMPVGSYLAMLRSREVGPLRGSKRTCH